MDGPQVRGLRRFFDDDEFLIHPYLAQLESRTVETVIHKVFFMVDNLPRGICSNRERTQTLMSEALNSLR